MTLKEYLKDKTLEIVIYLGSMCAILLFSAAFHFPLEFMIMLIVVFGLMISFIISVDFYKRKTYYDRIHETLDGLDKKYLISEMLPCGNFIDARFFADILFECNKSMCDRIADYRTESREFKEYLEMWVHEVKLPLSSLELMHHNNVTEFSEQALEQLRRIDQDTDTVLYYVRSENSEKDYVIKEVSLKDVTRRVLSTYREDLLLNGMNPEIRNLDIRVFTDAKWLEFIMGQVISNSIKYKCTDRTAYIRIYACEEKEAVKLFIEDNGVGISENDLLHIFDKSFTGENGRTTRKSTGMGLYIVKKLCTRLGHKIGCESKKGEFTRIIITFGNNDIYKVTKM